MLRWYALVQKRCACIYPFLLEDAKIQKGAKHHVADTGRMMQKSKCGLEMKLNKISAWITHGQTATVLRDALRGTRRFHTPNCR